MNGGSSPTIDSCAIQNNHFDGILVSANGSGSPTLQGNWFYSNGEGTYYGIYFYNSNGTVRQNTVENNLYGIVASDQSLVNSSDSARGGCNLAISNAYGVLAYNDGHLRFGRPGNIGSRNNISGNATYQAVANNNSSIISYHDYWGNSKIYHDTSSSILIDSALSSLPKCALPLLSDSGFVLSADTSQPNAIEGAYRILTMRVYETAASTFKKILETPGTAALWPRALVGLYFTFTGTKDKSLIDYVARVGKANSSLSLLASELLMNMNTIVGDFAQVCSIADNLRSVYAGTDVEIWVLIHLASLVGFSETQRNVSSAAYAELKSKYSDRVNQSLLVALAPQETRVHAKGP